MRRWLLVVLMVWCVDAVAEVVLDQQQPLIAEPALWSQMGGSVEQKQAQTVTAGVTGRLVEVQAPIACRSGEVILEIRRLDGDRPDGEILSADIFRAFDFPRLDPTPPVPSFQRLVLRTPLFFAAGERFAISLRDKSGECAVARSPGGSDVYTRGEAWFINNTPPTTDWTRMPVAGSETDWPFKTFMDVDPTPPGRDRSRPCTVHGLPGGGIGGTPIPFIPDWLPVCRCIQDEGLRELRCALFHPDFFLMRRIPSPLKPDEVFKVRWTLVPLGKLTGVLELTEEWPDGFKSSLKSPLTFFVDQLPQGASTTLEYEAVAGQKGGKAASSILFGGRGDQMGTTIEVQKK